jgi:thiol:disulfide interchange protein
MRNLSRIHSLILGLAFAGFITASAPAAEAPARPPIYDTKADGAKQISDALATAKLEHKNVILQFGANWCGWCHKLHKLFQSDKEIAAVLKDNYIVVLIDVDTVDGKPHNADTNTKYGNPGRFGLPALVVLDENGKQLTTQDTGKLEEGDHHDPGKVMAFLKQWLPKKGAAK